MNKKVQAGTLAGICGILLLLLACGQLTPGATIAGTSTPTFTPGESQLLDTGHTLAPAVTLTLTPSIIPTITITATENKYTLGEIEMHTPDVFGGGQDCISHLPFAINWGNNPPTASGEGEIACHFQSLETPTIHAVMEYAVTVEGRFKTGELGEKRILFDLTVDGSLSQYVTGVPEGASNPMPESDPVVIKENGPYTTLNFEFLNGAKTIVILGKGEKTFYLHLR